MKEQWIKFVSDLRIAFYNDKVLLDLVAAQDELVVYNQYGNEWIKAATDSIRIQMRATPEQLGVTVVGRDRLTLGNDDERVVHTATWSQAVYPIVFPGAPGWIKPITLIDDVSGETTVGVLSAKSTMASEADRLVKEADKTA